MPKTKLNYEARGVPESIWSNTDLITLNITNNGLDELDSRVGSMTRLTTLHVSKNNLTTFPPEIGQLVCLKALHAGSNSISVLPDEFGALVRLEKVGLDNNCLGTIQPEVLCGLSRLTALNLFGNDGIVLDLTPLAEIGVLQKLMLGHCALTELPPGTTLFGNLTDLALDYNSLTSLPDDIGNLVKLESLTVSHNQLAELPASVVTLEHLRKLDVRHNALSSLPEGLADMPSLFNVSVSGNDGLGQETNQASLNGSLLPFLRGEVDANQAAPVIPVTAVATTAPTSGSVDAVALSGGEGAPSVIYPTPSASARFDGMPGGLVPVVVAAAVLLVCVAVAASRRAS